MFGKNKEGMSESSKKAKLAALKEAHSMASDMMKEDLSGAKKVSVMSDSKKGLEKGLDMAKKIVDKDSPMGEQEDEDSIESDSMEAAQDGYEDQQDESMPMDEDDIDAQIEHLLKLKEKLQNC